MTNKLPDLVSSLLCTLRVEDDFLLRRRELAGAGGAHEDGAVAVQVGGLAGKVWDHQPTHSQLFRLKIKFKIPLHENWNTKACLYDFIIPTWVLWLIEIKEQTRFPYSIQLNKSYEEEGFSRISTLRG